MLRLRFARKLILSTTIMLAILLGVFATQASAQGMSLPENCELLHTYQDGRTLYLCPAPDETPLATPTNPPSIPTATPLPPTATPAQDPGSSDPYPGAPACPSHDPQAWHGLWDPVRGCHYDHHHGDNPHDVDDIFGTEVYDWAGGEISYPWQTISPTGCTENDCKHTGYVWLVRRDQPCESAYTDGCVVAFRAQIHAMSSSNSGAVRYHSAWVEALVCREDNPQVCGIVRAGGWQDTGDLLIDGVAAIDVPGNNNRVKLHYAETGNPMFATWYAGSPGGEGGRGGFFSVAIELGDLWGPTDPQDPTHLQFFCEDPNDGCARNGSRYQPHAVSIGFPPRLERIVDPDQDGSADYEGFANRYGMPVTGCSSVSLDCVPLVFESVPVDLSYQGRFEYREYDVLFGNQTSGWLKFPQ